MASSKQTKLDQLKADITKKNVCLDLANQAKNLVFGDGNPDADIVFIGEAPGKSEDEQGLPFVGAAGKFLDEMLRGINLKRPQVYITNIVKYRPPNNRDPLPEEKKEFLPILKKQLAIIEPLLLVALGRHSMECFLPDMQISKIHGQPKRIHMILGTSRESKITKDQEANEIVILPLFHPAAALYNGGLRGTLVEDFNKIPEIIKLIREGK
jgi:DNA polymerase